MFSVISGFMAKCQMTKPLWIALDSSLCSLIGFTSMLFYWRGLWDLYGAIVFPSDKYWCNWTVFGIGCGTIIGYFLHPAIGCALSNTRSEVVFFIVSRAYLYVFGLLKIAYFRGVWTLADYYLDSLNWLNAFIELIVCYAFLLGLMASRNVIFPPFLALPDTRPNLLLTSTWLKTQV
jgi:Fuseless